MENKEKIIKKVCSFYVNEWHLTTMMLPHINENITKDTQILTILENGIQERVEELISRMNLKEETKSKILSINWTSNKMYKYDNIEQYLKEKIKFKNSIEIIVNGKSEHINIINTNINKFINKNHKELKNKTITVINCYEASKYNDAKEIIKNHELILNTSGLRRVEEVFEKEQNQQVAN